MNAHTIFYALLTIFFCYFYTAITLNPIDLQIIGVEGRTKLLRSAFDLLEINESGEILPEDEEKLRELIKAVTAQAQQMAASIGAGGGEEKPMDRARENSGVKGVSGQPAPTRTLDASGAPMGGMEANFFQNRARPAQAAALPTPALHSPQPVRPASVSMRTMTESKEVTRPKSLVCCRS